MKCPSNPCKFRNKYGECFAPIEERVKRYCPVPAEPHTAEELLELYRRKFPQHLEDTAYIRQVQNV